MSGTGRDRGDVPFSTPRGTVSYLEGAVLGGAVSELERSFVRV